MDCSCATATAWWNPAGEIRHMLPFCAIAREAYRAFLDTLPDPDPPFGGRVGVVYDDGRSYRGFRGFDGVTFIPTPPSFGRPHA